MPIHFNTTFQLILTSLQLVVYIFMGCAAIYKIILSKKNNAKFLLLFYLFALLDILVYATMLLYQIIQLAFDREIHLVVLVIANVYSMIVEAVILFLLAFYWKETEAILRGKGINGQQVVSHVKRQIKLKTGLLTFWALVYTAFLVYALVKNQYVDDNIY